MKTQFFNEKPKDPPDPDYDPDQLPQPKPDPIPQPTPDWPPPDYVPNPDAPGNELSTLLANENYTGLHDDNKQPILVGDKLKSEWGYDVIVVKDGGNDYNGKLVCDDKHSCVNIPYSLNRGKGYKKIIC